MPLRTYVIPLLEKYNDDLGHYREPADVDGLFPNSHARMIVGNLDLTDEQHERFTALEHVTFLGLARDLPQAEDVVG